MIIVNIKVPSLEKVYNFSLEDTAKIQAIIEEVVELIAQKEGGIKLSGDIQEMTLYDQETGTHLNWTGSLREYGIQSGAELILV